MNIMTKKIIRKINCLTVMFIALSQIVYAQDNTAIAQDSTVLKPLMQDREVELVFTTTTNRQSTGSFYTIDVEEELKRDQGTSIGQAINGKVPGMFGGTNTWGTGGAAILIDGIISTRLIGPALGLTHRITSL